MRKISLIVILLSLSFFSFAETIQLKSGKIIEGKIVEETNSYIKVESGLSIPITYYFDDIETIDEKRFRTFGSNNNINSNNIQNKSAKQIFQQHSSAVAYIKTDKGWGSGFVIDKEGIIVTNFHVVAFANSIDIHLKNGKSYKPISVLVYNPLEDICILKINPDINLNFIPLGNEEKEVIGEKVFAIGNPTGGGKYSISDGIISQKDENIYRNIIQFTCPVSSGSSGGPLLNPKGKAIGVVTQLILPYDGINVSQNINYAVGISEVKALLENSKSITISQFFNRIKQNANFYKTQFYSSKFQPIEAYSILKRELQTCQNIKNKDCFFIWIESMRKINTILDHYMPKFKEGEQVNWEALSSWTVEGLNLLEFTRGVREAVKSYKLYFNPSDKSVKKTIENTFSMPYYFASFNMITDGNLEKARYYYRKFKTNAPNSGFVPVLEHFIKNFDKYH